MTDRILLFLITYPCILISLSFHEFSHAFSANKLGDPTAKYQGRLTLNPIKHIDLIGTVILPIIMAITSFPLFGWAKPVPVNPLNFRNTRRDMAIVSIAGPASNLILVFASYILTIIFSAILGSFSSDVPSIFIVIALFLYFLPLINVVLMIFNLLPVPPLDGADVLKFFLPLRAEQKYDRIFTNPIINFIVIIAFAWLILGFIINLFMTIYSALLPETFRIILYEGLDKIGLIA